MRDAAVMLAAMSPNPPFFPSRSYAMLKLARWCISHRRQVVVGWVAIAALTTVLGGAVGRQYATNFSLPGTESQHASDLLQREFKNQSGDLDTIVFQVSHGTVASPSVRAAI